MILAFVCVYVIASSKSSEESSRKYGFFVCFGFFFVFCFFLFCDLKQMLDDICDVLGLCWGCV